MLNKSERELLKEWAEYLANISKATPIDLNENKAEQRARVAALEKNHEKWFKYYFPNFYTSEPAPFHLRATKRVMDNSEWYEVRPWARDLSKSGRTMMEVLKLTLTGKKQNVLLISATNDDAKRLLRPYRGILEANNRIIHDYGVQKSTNKWTEEDFTTKKGVNFRAIGAGESPRGTRNDAARPDVILIDDIDTDEEVRNKERIKNKVQWVEEALIPTRSVSNDLLVLVCGNIIGRYTTVTELMKKADFAEIVNIRDKNGKSTWPQKNSEERIDRVLSKLNTNSAQKEYFNNPQNEGEVFKDITYGRAPLLRSCEHVVAYFDPSTSNKDKATSTTASSTKSGVIIGFKDLKFYVYWVRVGHVSNATFVQWLFQAHEHMMAAQVKVKNIYIENNSLQDPFYTQVIRPLILAEARSRGYSLPVSPDSRKKPDKFFRIEGTLEPLNRNGELIFSDKLKGQKMMELAEEQMLGVSETSKTMDFPDGLEGGVYIIQNRTFSQHHVWASGGTNNRKY